MDRLGKYSLAYDPEEYCLPVAWYRHGEYSMPWEGNNPVRAMFYALLESREKLKEFEKGE